MKDSTAIPKDERMSSKLEITEQDDPKSRSEITLLEKNIALLEFIFKFENYINYITGAPGACKRDSEQEKQTIRMKMAGRKNRRTYERAKRRQSRPYVRGRENGDQIIKEGQGEQNIMKGTRRRGTRPFKRGREQADQTQESSNIQLYLYNQVSK